MVNRNHNLQIKTSMGKIFDCSKKINPANNIKCYYGINGWNVLILSVEFAGICSALIGNAMEDRNGLKPVDLGTTSIEGNNNVI